MNQTDLHRNLLRVVLYAAGVVILVMAIPALIALIVTAAAMASVPRVPVEMGLDRVMSAQFTASVAQGLVGIMLAWCSKWLSLQVYPIPEQADQNEEA